MTIQDSTTDCAAAHARLRPDTSAAITAILVNTEATAHRYGWDQQPVLFGLFDHVATGDTATVEVDPSLTEPGLWTTPGPHLPGGSVQPPVVLHRLATDLASPAARRWLGDWLHAGGRTCVGVGIVFEAWAGRIRPGYRHGDLSNAPAGQRREIRVVAAVDTDLGLHRIIRVRGTDAPRVNRWAQIPVGSRHRRIVAGLHRLVRIARSL